MHPSVQCSTIYNSQDVEETYMSINRGLDKDDVVLKRIGIRKEQHGHTTTCRTDGQSTVPLRELNPGLCDNPEGWGGEGGGREGQEGGVTCIPLADSC